ncbi:MAG TPA: NAD(P)H-hydrate dehydratase, partial [Lachnospiraceae bacterium]|nr:NAD(P)H-hydrate dehydratase [Lachnospiraceae bacterium]
FIHGAAGDAAAEKLGRYSLMAGDIADNISEVLKF